MPDYDYPSIATTSKPEAPTDLSLAMALGELREVAAIAAKAAEEYLVARDRWLSVRHDLDRVQERVNQLRVQADGK